MLTTFPGALGVHVQSRTYVLTATTTPTLTLHAFCTMQLWPEFPVVRVLTVSSSATQTLLAALVGLVVVVVVMRLSRRGSLSFRYTIGWVVVASLGILAGLFIPLATPIASALGMSSAALLAVMALIIFVAISIQLSISISGLQQQVRTLTEDLARLRHTIHTSSPRGD